jgi:DNA-binding winged helix-turn-helix (wHTH) protein
MHLTSSYLAEKLQSPLDSIVTARLDILVNVNGQGSRKASFSPYEFDPASGILTRSGTRLRLESQPARVLELLLDASGQMVARAEIISALWPGETEGDFDRRLDKAVAKLRARLNDDPLKPRFIETIKGRGYRFLAEVAGVSPQKQFSTKVNVPSRERENWSLPGRAAVEPTGAASPPVPPEIALALPATTVGAERGSAPAIVRRRRHFSGIAISAAVILAGFVLYFRWQTRDAGHNPRPEDLELTRVTISGDIKAADISPDGKYVAYARLISGQESLWLRQLATGRVLQVTTLGTDQCWASIFRRMATITTLTAIGPPPRQATSTASPPWAVKLPASSQEFPERRQFRRMD